MTFLNCTQSYLVAKNKVWGQLKKFVWRIGPTIVECHEGLLRWHFPCYYHVAGDNSYYPVCWYSLKQMCCGPVIVIFSILKKIDLIGMNWLYKKKIIYSDVIDEF